MIRATRQTVAIFAEVYRSLSSGWLFRGCVLLALAVLIALAGIRIDATEFGWYGITLSDNLTTETLPAKDFFLGLFAFAVIPMLNWGLTAIGLIATARLVPEAASPGSVDQMLAKPISRWRLFLTRYAAGLLFVLMLAVELSVGWVLITRYRTGEWAFEAMYAVPIIVMMFSGLYAVSALVGLLSRSTLTAIIVTGLFWVMCMGLQTTDAVINGIKTERENELGTAELSVEVAESFPDDPEAIGNIDELRADVEALQASVDAITFYTNGISVIRSVLPMTGETIDLLQRWTVPRDSLISFMLQVNSNTTREDAQREIETTYSETRILASTLGFQIFIVGIATIIFARRDF